MLLAPPGKCYVRPIDGAILERKHAQPPLGLAYIAGAVRNAGYDVEILDILLEGYDNEVFIDNYVVYGLSHFDIVGRIREVKPDIIGIGILFSHLANEVFKVVEAIRLAFPDIPIVLGGHHPSAMPERVLEGQTSVDYVLSGEADLTFPQFLNALNGEGALDAVKGLYWREDGAIKSTKPGGAPAYQGNDYAYYARKDSPNPGDLAALSFPAWDLFDMPGYWACEVRQGGGNAMHERYAVMVTTRGCPHVCDFCTSPLMGGYRYYRKRPIEDIVAEIRWLRDEYGVGEVHFMDDNLFVAQKRAKEMLRAFIDNFPGMTFVNPPGSEVNALDDELIELMKKAGWTRAIIAIESADEEIQEKRVDKKVKVDRVPEVVAKCKEVGLEIRGYFMLGFPDETREQVLKTANMARDLDLDDFSLSLVSPLPGTPLYDECNDRELLTETYDADDVRYALSHIRHRDISGDELADIRSNYWRENKEKWIERQHQHGKEVHRTYQSIEDYSETGFANKPGAN